MIQSNDNKKNVRTNWRDDPSPFALKTCNPIRTFVEKIQVKPNPQKYVIPLSLGDPTIFGNLRAAPQTIQAVKDVIESGDFNGYAHTAGRLESRQAICNYVYETQGEISPDDVILTNGCSAALDYCITVLGCSGKNVLIPRPGFCMYRTLAEGHGIELRSYNLLPERNWEIDLHHLESLIDENTAALVLCNPSNPCGSVFKRKHLQSIINLAEKYFLPIIADEIYEHLVYPGVEYCSVSSLSKTVPVLSCGGLTKRFLVPGWRMGWVIIHDRNNKFLRIKKGLSNLAARFLGPNSLIQAALPDILRNTPQSFFDNLVNTLYKHATLAYYMLRDVPGIRPIMPGGAMYMMIGIDMDCFPEYKNDLDIVKDLVKEQSVSCVPGQCFDFPMYLRIVLTVPENMIVEACARIVEFCTIHYKNGKHIF